MIEERQKLEKTLEEFRLFLTSRVHLEYQLSTRGDLRALEERILEDEITSLPDFITLLDLRTQRRVLRSNLTSFEDTVANLESRIMQMKHDEENTNAAQQENNDDDEIPTT